jgi:hypothetical protein
MNIVVQTPENYIPHMEKNGTYVDKIPPYTAFTNGIICPCNTRKSSTIFYDTCNFSLHTKCKKHKQWLEEINTNRINYYENAITLKKNLGDAQIIIALKDKKINELESVISILLGKLEKIENPPMDVDDLLECEY